MTDAIKLPTICKECKHSISKANSWTYWRCRANVVQENFVNEDGPSYAYCEHINKDGHCPDYEPAERIAAQAQADCEGVQG